MEPATHARPQLAVVALIAALVSVVVIVASIAFMSLRLTDRTGSLSERVTAVVEGDDQIQAQRDAVMATAEQFALRVHTYGPGLLAKGGTMPTYRRQVSQVITPKYQASFERDVRFAEATVAQAGLARRAQVYATGVASMDADSAEVLVAGSYTNSYPRPGSPRKRVDDLPRPFQWQVKLILTDGQWLVDDFEIVAAPDSGLPSGGSGAGR